MNKKKWHKSDFYVKSSMHRQTQYSSHYLVKVIPVIYYYYNSNSNNNNNNNNINNNNNNNRNNPRRLTIDETSFLNCYR